MTWASKKKTSHTTTSAAKGQRRTADQQTGFPAGDAGRNQSFMTGPRIEFEVLFFYGWTERELSRVTSRERLGSGTCERIYRFGDSVVRMQFACSGFGQRERPRV
ncbi:hypothetical protein Mal33_19730 [Rosistilla oblonga]|uniref:Uncharacterized protein n=1 Tax=Rosistilla oblonga TaxID=2527990 RepID=A0A518ISD2_9BACT|nr:hypothetical protein Mal33_19730 [Rosistilla oblonga]